MIRRFFTEAIKNIRTNLLLNAAIIVLIVAVMTFLGIVTLQVQISGLTTEVEMKHEAFVELSQYRFLISGDDYINRLNRNTRNGLQPNEDDIYICYPLSKDPATNARFIANAARFWEFMQKMKSIPGVYSYFISTSKYLANGQHDAYLGYYVPDSTTDYAVTLDFFEIETLTYLKGRAPKEEDFYIDDDGLQVVPIVVGYQLRDTFELGDTVEIKGMLEKYNPEDLKQRIVKMGKYSRGKVVGILTQSNTVTIADGAHFLYLYAGIIRAVKDPSPDIFPELKNDADAYIYASWQAIQNLATSKIYLNKA
ncbi:MAG: hypothetical protein J5816_03065, partial [Clostridia bacterium]|nr:hypothetical protein [Clostridia bacterium]